MSGRSRMSRFSIWISTPGEKRAKSSSNTVLNEKLPGGRQEVDQHRDRPAVEVEAAELKPARVPGGGERLAEEGLGLRRRRRARSLPCPSSRLSRGRGRRRTRRRARRGRRACALRPGRARRAGCAEAAELLALLLADRPLVIGLRVEIALEEGAHRRWTAGGAAPRPRWTGPSSARPRKWRKPGAQIGRVERGDRRGPEGPLLAGGDQRRAEKGLVVAPVADDPDRQAAHSRGRSRPAAGRSAARRAAPRSGGCRGRRPASAARRRRTNARRRHWARPPRRRARSIPVVERRPPRGGRDGGADGHGSRARARARPVGRQLDPAHGSHGRAIARREVNLWCVRRSAAHSRDIGRAARS